MLEDAAHPQRPVLPTGMASTLVGSSEPLDGSTSTV